MNNNQFNAPRKVKKSLTVAFRVTATELEMLDVMRGNIPVSTYVRGILFTNPEKRKKRRKPKPCKDFALLAKALGCLGKALGNLNQIAKAVNSGLLSETAEVETLLADVRGELQQISALIKQALNLTGEQ